MTDDDTGADGSDADAGADDGDAGTDGDRHPSDGDRERSPGSAPTPDREAYRRQVRESFPELADVDDGGIREAVLAAWVTGLARGGWRHVEDVPYAWNIHEVTNVEHVRGVTRIAVGAAREQREFHGADPDLDVVRAACLLHDVGKCYEYVGHVDDELVDPDPEYCGETIPHSLSGYALAHEAGAPMAVQRAIPHFVGEVPDRTLEAELVKAANSASSNAITQATMGISLDEWVRRYSQTSD